MDFPALDTDPAGRAALYPTPLLQYRLAIRRCQNLTSESAGGNTAHATKQGDGTHSWREVWRQPGPLELWLRWVHGLPSLTECPRFCMRLTRRRNLPSPSAKGENTLIQRKSLWINLLTFRFVINTYRCLYVNGILGKPHVNTPLGTKTSGADTRKYCICTSLY